MMEIVLGVITVMLINGFAVFSFATDRHKVDMEGHTMILCTIALFMDYCIIKGLFF